MCPGVTAAAKTTNEARSGRFGTDGSRLVRGRCVTSSSNVISGARVSPRGQAVLPKWTIFAFGQSAIVALSGRSGFASDVSYSNGAPLRIAQVAAFSMDCQRALTGTSTTVVGAFTQKRAASTAVSTLVLPPTRVKGSSSAAGAGCSVPQSEYAPIPTTASATKALNRLMMKVTRLIRVCRSLARSSASLDRSCSLDRFFASSDCLSACSGGSCACRGLLRHRIAAGHAIRC